MYSRGIPYISIKVEINYNFPRCTQFCKKLTSGIFCQESILITILENGIKILQECSKQITL